VSLFYKGPIVDSQLTENETIWSTIILSLLFLAVPFSASGQTIDPTKGQFINDTRWGIEIFIDQDPQSLQSTPGIVLNPQ
jgi:hypothetical protein